MDMLSVSSKGQIVIPKEVRKSMRIKTGSKLMLIERDNSIVLKREEEIERYMKESEKKEEIGWMALAEKSLAKDWDGEDEVWSKYL